MHQKMLSEKTQAVHLVGPHFGTSTTVSKSPTGVVPCAAVLARVVPQATDLALLAPREQREETDVKYAPITHGRLSPTCGSPL